MKCYTDGTTCASVYLRIGQRLLVCEIHAANRHCRELCKCTCICNSESFTANITHFSCEKSLSLVFLKAGTYDNDVRHLTLREAQGVGKLHPKRRQR